MLEINDRVRIPLREFSFSYSRSSGAGGQNVNKVNTRATLRWAFRASRSLPADVRERFAARYRRRITQDGDFVLHSQRFRDQGRNTADCIEKLRAMLREVADPPRARRPTRPTRASKERRLRQKRVQKQRKEGRRRPRSDDD